MSKNDLEFNLFCLSRSRSFSVDLLVLVTGKISGFVSAISGINSPSFEILKINVKKSESLSCLNYSYYFIC